MKAHKLIFDQSTFGVTGKSLRLLRNALASNLRDKILVVEVPTADILCGFLVLNQTNGTAIWSGDGFRTDKGGEGGRGYKAAHVLIETFGARCWNVYSEETIALFKNAVNIHTSEAEIGQELLKACNKAAEEFEDAEYQCLMEAIPGY